MTIIQERDFIRYLPDKGKQLYFADNEERLYAEIVISIKDQSVVKEK